MDRTAARLRLLVGTLAFVLALPLHACSPTGMIQQMAPTEGQGAAPGVNCTEAELREYRDLERLSQEQPLTRAQQERMEELYRRCFEAEGRWDVRPDDGPPIGRTA